MIRIWLSIDWKARYFPRRRKSRSDKSEQRTNHCVIGPRPASSASLDQPGIWNPPGCSWNEATMPQSPSPIECPTIPKHEYFYHRMSSQSDDFDRRTWRCWSHLNVDRTLERHVHCEYQTKRRRSFRRANEGIRNLHKESSCLTCHKRISVVWIHSDWTRHSREFCASGICSSLDLEGREIEFNTFLDQQWNEPVSVSQSLTVLSYDAERNEVPFMLKFTSRTAWLCPAYVRTQRRSL